MPQFTFKGLPNMLHLSVLCFCTLRFLMRNIRLKTKGTQAY